MWYNLGQLCIILLSFSSWIPSDKLIEIHLCTCAHSPDSPVRNINLATFLRPSGFVHGFGQIWLNVPGTAVSPEGTYHTKLVRSLSLVGTSKSNIA